MFLALDYQSIEDHHAVKWSLDSADDFTKFADTLQTCLGSNRAVVVKEGPNDDETEETIRTLCRM